MKRRITTAAYLAGVTSLAVTLPMMANASSYETKSTSAAQISSDLASLAAKGDSLEGPDKLLKSHKFTKLN